MFFSESKKHNSIILYDVYIVKRKSNKKNILDFINLYLPNFICTDDYYEYPKYENPTIFEKEVFTEMLDFVFREKGREYTFYLDNNSSLEYLQGIISLNSDGSAFLGLGVVPEYEEKYIEKLSKKITMLTYLFVTTFLHQCLYLKPIKLQATKPITNQLF